MINKSILTITCSFFVFLFLLCGFIMDRSIQNNSAFYHHLAYLSRGCYLKFKESSNSAIVINKDQLDIMIKERSPDADLKLRDSMIFDLLLQDSLPLPFLQNKIEGVHYQRINIKDDSLRLSIPDTLLLRTCFDANHLIKQEYIKDYKGYLVAKLFDMKCYLYNEDESGYLYYWKE